MKNFPFVYFSRRKNKNLLFRFGLVDAMEVCQAVNWMTQPYAIFYTQQPLLLMLLLLLLLVVCDGTRDRWCKQKNLNSLGQCRIVTFDSFQLSFALEIWLGFIDATRTKPVEQGCTTQCLNNFFAHSRTKYLMCIKQCYYESKKINKLNFGLCGPDQKLSRATFGLRAVCWACLL